MRGPTVIPETGKAWEKPRVQQIRAFQALTDSLLKQYDSLHLSFGW